MQCAGFLQHHKYVDNLGLVVEYDLQEKTCLNEAPPSGKKFHDIVGSAYYVAPEV
ncbi:unnamed protein product [Rhodiola kirilowii]